MPHFKPTGPISLLGAPQQQQAPVELPTIRLKVIGLPPSAARGGPAMMHLADATALLAARQAAGAGGGSQPMLQLGEGSDCILGVRPSPAVPEGCLMLDDVQCHNLHLLAGDCHTFKWFDPPAAAGGDAPFELVELTGEVLRIAPPPPQTGQQQRQHQHQQGLATSSGNGLPTEAAATAGSRAAADASADSTGGDTTSDGSSSGCSTPTSADGGLPLGGAGPGSTPAPPGAPAAFGNGTSTSGSSAVCEAVEVDAQQLAAALSRQYFGRVVAANELLVVTQQPQQPQGGPLEVLVRVTEVHALEPEEREDALAYHCYRGRLQPQTAIYLRPADHAPQQQQQQQQRQANGRETSAAPGGDRQQPHSQPQQQQQQQPAPRLALTNVRERAALPPPTNTVHITTRDGELFPVKKALLRPCIALTRVVRDSAAAAPAVTVDVDTLTFDRVLLFLEALALAKAPPQWSLHLLDDLAQAAATLDLKPLAQYCEERQGRLAAGLRVWRYNEVVDANAGRRQAALPAAEAANGSSSSGNGSAAQHPEGEQQQQQPDAHGNDEERKVLLVLDGMVLDVGRWLPEHPGGATIIPRQSLNMDCARFFEIYHASRESFLYLKDFYVGELHPHDRPGCPAGDTPPSEDFLAQLRAFTTWRVPVEELAAAAAGGGQDQGGDAPPKAFKSF